MSQHALPGADFITAGLADLATGKTTVAALLVSVGAPRLRSLGVVIPRIIPDAEHRLYEVLAEAEPRAAHARYNALVRRLVSYERALACAR